MNVGYSVSKLKAMIESNNKGGKVAYPLDNFAQNEVTQLNNFQYLFNYGSIAAVNGELYRLGGNGYSNIIEKLSTNGKDWWFYDNTPMYIEKSAITSFNGNIHVFGSASSAYSKNHYKFDGTDWTKMSDIPSGTPYCACHDNEFIYIIITNKLYKYDDTTDAYIELSTVPTPFSDYRETSIIYDEKNNLLRVFYADKYTSFNLNTNQWISTVTTLDRATENSARMSVCYFNGHIYGVPSPGKTNDDGTYNLIYKFDRVSKKWECVYKGNEFVPVWSSIEVFKNQIYIATGNNTYTSFRYDCSNGIQGYVEKDTKVYYPINSYVIKGDMEIVDGGYIAKSDGEVVIGKAGD